MSWRSLMLLSVSEFMHRNSSACPGWRGVRAEMKIAATELIEEEVRREDRTVEDKPHGGLIDRVWPEM